MRVSTHVEADYKDIQDAVIAAAKVKADVKEPGSATVKFFPVEQLEKTVVELTGQMESALQCCESSAEAVLQEKMASGLRKLAEDLKCLTKKLTDFSAVVEFVKIKT